MTRLTRVFRPQGLIAFKQTGFLGDRARTRFQKLNYLPAAYTDFIYAAIGEELGLMERSA